jgi:hypothetical protein
MSTKANVCEIRVIALINAGWYMNEIARNFNASPVTIQRIANENELEFKKYLAEIDESKEAQLVDDFLINKIGVEKLFSKYRIGKDLLKRIFVRNNLEYPKVALEEKYNHLLPQIKYLVEESELEQKYIAKQLGVPKNAIRDFIKRFGWKRQKWKRRHFRDIWKRDFGESDGGEKYQEYLKLHEGMSKGCKNPMYGKPSPRGSGNGWKGWFKDEYFRSLRELSFLIHLNDNDIKYESAERKKYTIKYFWEGSERTYRPDFIIGNTLYEIKPKRLINTPNVMAKTKAAKDFCLKNDLEYKIMDFDINTSAILTHLENGNVKFARNYLEKFLEFINQDKISKPKSAGSL